MKYHYKITIISFILISLSFGLYTKSTYSGEAIESSVPNHAYQENDDINYNKDSNGNQPFYCEIEAPKNLRVVPDTDSINSNSKNKNINEITDPYSEIQYDLKTIKKDGASIDFEIGEITNDAAKNSMKYYFKLKENFEPRHLKLLSLKVKDEPKKVIAVYLKPKEDHQVPDQNDIDNFGTSQYFVDLLEKDSSERALELKEKKQSYDQSKKKANDAFLELKEKERNCIDIEMDFLRSFLEGMIPHDGNINLTPITIATMIIGGIESSYDKFIPAFKCYIDQKVHLHYTEEMTKYFIAKEIYTIALNAFKDSDKKQQNQSNKDVPKQNDSKNDNRYEQELYKNLEDGRIMDLDRQQDRNHESGDHDDRIQERIQEKLEGYERA